MYIRKELALALVAALAPGCAAAPDNSGDAQSPHRSDGIRLLADFDGSDPAVDRISGRWRTVNDSIMGGRSSGGGEIRDGVMIFSGSTNTNGGGFSSIRAGEKRWDLSGFDGLAARIRADGRRYDFHIDTGLRADNGNVFYRGSFETRRLVDAETGSQTEAQTESTWQEVFVPFSEFVPMVRGRDVSDRIGRLDPSSIRSTGLMIDDGLDGAFRLEADRIKAVSQGHPESDPARPGPPRGG